jgi:hypothetical protein
MYYLILLFIVVLALILGIITTQLLRIEKAIVRLSEVVEDEATKLIE